MQFFPKLICKVTFPFQIFKKFDKLTKIKNEKQVHKVEQEGILVLADTKAHNKAMVTRTVVLTRTDKWTKRNENLKLFLRIQELNVNKGATTI